MRQFPAGSARETQTPDWLLERGGFELPSPLDFILPHPEINPSSNQVLAFFAEPYARGRRRAALFIIVIPASKVWRSRR